MNLVEQLLKADAKKADEMEKGTFKSKRLAKIIGSEEETVDVEITEINSRRVNEIISYQVDRKGKFDISKSYDAKLIMCIEGCSNPDLTDKDLQKHFGCDNAKDLCEKLFGFEVNELSDAIASLCGVSNGDDETEKEIKN